MAPDQISQRKIIAPGPITRGAPAGVFRDAKWYRRDFGVGVRGTNKAWGGLWDPSPGLGFGAGAEKYPSLGPGGRSGVGRHPGRCAGAGALGAKSKEVVAVAARVGDGPLRRRGRNRSAGAGPGSVDAERPVHGARSAEAGRCLAAHQRPAGQKAIGPGDGQSPQDGALIGAGGGVPHMAAARQGDGSEGTPALWVRGLGRRTIMSDIDV